MSSVYKPKDPDGIPCPNEECTSSDGFKDQGNGWGHCFVCGTNKKLNKDEQPSEKRPAVVALPRPKRPLIPMGERFTDLEDRGISKATCEKYKIWREDGKDYFANFNEGKHCGTKWRDLENKRLQSWTGEQHELFGQHLFPPNKDLQLTITEGEYDAPSAYEMMGSKWPVVSVINGTGSAVLDIKRNFEYCNGFKNVVLSFDNDEAGVAAAKAVSGLPWPAGKLRIMRHKLHKDANDYKLANNAGAYTKEWWDAPAFMPDGLKLGSALWDSIVNRPNHFSTTYPWQGLNLKTYGIRLSEFVVVTAETGIGKTSVLKEIEYKLLMDPEIKEKGYGVGFLHLEEPDYDTCLGLMSIHVQKPLFLPDTPRTEEELREAYDAVVNNERVVVWDHFGSNSVDAVLNKVRHMAALGCKYIVLDHLSIIVSDQDGDERKRLDEISTKLKTLCMELNIALIGVIHQNRAGQIRGTAGVEQLANIVFKLYRDNTDIDPWRRNVTKIVVEKNRFCGRTGIACYLWWNEMTNRLVELNEEEVTKYEEGGTVRDYEVPF
jgi:twinkle protein